MNESVPLFGNPTGIPNKRPLAHRLAPKSFDDYFGQHDVLSAGKPIREMIESDQLKSMILWGPPGCGKTSLARLIARQTRSKFVAANAVDSGVQDIKATIKEAERLPGRTILFLDEIHRFNKAQQDILLPSVERGIITLIGATTENPYFSVIPGLLSRCLVAELSPLPSDALTQILQNAIGQTPWEPEAIAFAVVAAQGDARRLLNIVETTTFVSNAGPVTVSQIKDITQKMGVAHGDDAHYDLISALIKSMRASNPDGAIYWLARLLKGGEDPRFIARRLLIFASEDIGNADPYALTLAASAMTGATTIGMPEVRIILGQAVTYLSCAPKSNASYVAINAAMKMVEDGHIEPVPPYLKSNSPGGYIYPHDVPDGIVTQQV